MMMDIMNFDVKNARNVSCGNFHRLKINIANSTNIDHDVASPFVAHDENNADAITTNRNEDVRRTWFIQEKEAHNK